LAKLKILLVKDIERDEIEFTCKTLQVSPLLYPIHSDALAAACLFLQACSAPPSRQSTVCSRPSLVSQSLWRKYPPLMVMTSVMMNANIV
jgi:hypothetical protein